MKPEGTDEPTPDAPGAKPDEATPAAPAPASAALDWKGYLQKAEEQFNANPPDLDRDDTDLPAQRHLPSKEEALTEDDGFHVDEGESSEEAVEDNEVGPTDGAAASEQEPVELEEEILASPTALEQRLQEKESSERELIQLKGRLGRKIGDLVKTLKLHGLDENGEPLKTEMSEEERKSRQDKAISEVMDDPEAWFDRRLADRLGQAAEELDEIQSRQSLQDAQNGGFRSFQARYKINTDPVVWAKGPEGQAWREALESSPRDRAAFERFMETGNKDGITLVLSDVYDRVLAKRKGSEVMGRKGVQQARTEKRKSPVLAGSPRPRPARTGGVDISKPSNWMKVVEMARRQRY
jgi:hypothetical protein